MDIQILGAHNCESKNTKCTSLLIDEKLVIDAGGLTSSLPFSAQLKLKAILLTHQHYDHIKDIPAIGMNFALQETSINVYSISTVYNVLTTHMLNGSLYPKFQEWPEAKPAIKFSIIEPYQTQQFDGYNILAVPVNHSVPTIGYQVTSHSGKSVFYTGDTGPGVAECWKHISPHLLIIEVIASNKYEDFAKEVGHLTPSLLKEELISFQKLKNYLPQIITVHMSPFIEKEIKVEIVALAEELNSSITLAYEGMQLHL
jgi:ribonuclease BN (tRNA processing enzyme)